LRASTYWTYDPTERNIAYLLELQFVGIRIKVGVRRLRPVQRVLTSVPERITIGTKSLKVVDCAVEYIFQTATTHTTDDPVLEIDDTVTPLTRGRRNEMVLRCTSGTIFLDRVA
jgi:hypothetical protein